MVGKTKLLACTSLFAVAMLAGTSAFAGTSSSGPSNAELQQEIDNIQNELQSSQLKVSQAQSGAITADDLKKATTGWWSNTSVNGRMYYDVSWIRNESNGNKNLGSNANANGVAFDIKRFYVGIDHKFNDTYSANVTTDFQYSSAISSTELYIKKAYLQAKYSDALQIRLGATDLPWVPFVEDLYGYRFVENVVTDRTKFGTSSDWGVHASGKFGGGVLNYAVAVLNGAEYKSPSGAGNGVHFKSVDFEGRANLNLSNFIIAVGGHVGRNGTDLQTSTPATTNRQGSRIDALGAYNANGIRLGVEYFHATDYKVKKAAASAEADGFSGFASYQFDPKWSVFGRYDYVEPNTKLAVKTKDNYFNVGIDFSPTKIVDFALTYKYEKTEHGTLGTSNGTIGGSNDGTYNEVGIFSQFRW